MAVSHRCGIVSPPGIWFASTPPASPAPGFPGLPVCCPLDVLARAAAGSARAELARARVGNREVRFRDLRGSLTNDLRKVDVVTVVKQSRRRCVRLAAGGGSRIEPSAAEALPVAW